MIPEGNPFFPNIRSSDALLSSSAIQQSFHLAEKIFKHENLTKPSTHRGRFVDWGCILAAASRINSDGKVGSGFASAGLSRRLAPADAPSFSFSSEQVEMHARFFPRAAIARRVIQRSHSPQVLSSILTCRMFLAVAWLSSGKRRGEEDAWAVRPSG